MKEKKTAIAIKREMTQVFGPDGLVSPVTALVIPDPEAFSWLKEGIKVLISGKTKGRGFAGVVKRWGFSGGPMTHGSGWSRKPGSIGGTAAPGRVYRGKKMPGRMGGDKQTKKNIRILGVNEAEKEILVKGPMPGTRGSKLLISLLGEE